MKKLIIKLLSLLICLHYSLMVKAFFSESSDTTKIRAKLVSISKSVRFLALSGHET